MQERAVGQATSASVLELLTLGRGGASSVQISPTRSASGVVSPPPTCLPTVVQVSVPTQETPFSQAVFSFGVSEERVVQDVPSQPTARVPPSAAWPTARQALAEVQDMLASELPA